MGKIFINYRREENLRDARHLKTQLEKHFGADNVFLDVGGIDGGTDWVEKVQQQVAESDAMLALIGVGWADLKDEQGNRRLGQPDDFVRFELAQAIVRRIPILPVLLDGATAPKLPDLPRDILPLLNVQCVDLHTQRFPEDAGAIAKRLQALIASRSPRSVSMRRIMAVAAAALVIGAVIGLIAAYLFGLGPTPSEILIRAEQRASKAEQLALRERDEAKSELAKANVELTNLQKQHSIVGGDLAKVQAEAGRLTAALAAAQRDKDQAVAAVQRERDQARADLSGTNTRIAELQKQLSSTTRAAEEARRDPALAVTPGSGQSFRDLLANGQPCPMCPEMVVVPPGSFMMGAPESEPGRVQDRETPQLRQTVARPFAAGKFAITFDEWDACIADGGCSHQPGDRGWGRGHRPVINVSWVDVGDYVSWLSRKSGKEYRVLTEVEREYATRAGTTTPFWWGRSITAAQANYDIRLAYDGVTATGGFHGQTVPVDSFRPNPWGLYNVHGNIYEWVAECWAVNLVDIRRASSERECVTRAVRGGSWNSSPNEVRSAARSSYRAGARVDNIGFRVTRSITP